MIRRTRQPLGLLLALPLLLAIAGCAAEEPAPEPAAEEPAAEEPTAAPAGGEPDIYFVNVEDGGTYTSPLEIIFGVDHFAVVPVEDPPVVREGEGHYHLAYDVPCAEMGTIIPQGTPSYIHFGDGSDRINIQLEPGAHTLCLQMADGEHRVIAGLPGLTEEITVTIEASDS